MLFIHLVSEELDHLKSAFQNLNYFAFGTNDVCKMDRRLNGRDEKSERFRIRTRFQTHLVYELVSL